MFLRLARRLARWAVVAVALFVVVPRLDGQGLAEALENVPILGAAVTSPSAPPAPAEAGFTRYRADGSPVGFPPCQEVSWQFNPGPLGPEGLAEAKWAVRRAEKASGVNFTFAGLTSEVPSSAPSPGAMVTVGWVSPAQTDALPDGISAGTIVMFDEPDGDYHTGGSIALNVEHLDRFSPGQGPSPSRGALLLHELGHLVGLGHAPAPGSLMHPTLGEQSPEEFTHAEAKLLAQLPRCS